MQDEPTPQELLTAVAGWLRNELMPVAPADKVFHVRVAANAIDLALRQLAQARQGDAAERGRLAALLGRDGDLAMQNAALAEGIASGAVDADNPAVIDHLYATTLEKLAVDQPAYAAYRRAAGLEAGKTGR